jgi:hypothetical protein
MLKSVWKMNVSFKPAFQTKAAVRLLYLCPLHRSHIDSWEMVRAMTGIQYACKPRAKHLSSIPHTLVPIL